MKNCPHCNIEVIDQSLGRHVSECRKNGSNPDKVPDGWQLKARFVIDQIWRLYWESPNGKETRDYPDTEALINEWKTEFPETEVESVAFLKARGFATVHESMGE